MTSLDLLMSACIELSIQISNLIDGVLAERTLPGDPFPDEDISIKQCLTDNMADISSKVTGFGDEIASLIDNLYSKLAGTVEKIGNRRLIVHSKESEWQGGANIYLFPGDVNPFKASCITGKTKIHSIGCSSVIGQVNFRKALDCGGISTSSETVASFSGSGAPPPLMAQSGLGVDAYVWTLFGDGVQGSISPVMNCYYHNIHLFEGVNVCFTDDYKVWWLEGSAVDTEFLVEVSVVFDVEGGYDDSFFWK